MSKGCNGDALLLSSWSTELDGVQRRQTWGCTAAVQVVHQARESEQLTGKPQISTDSLPRQVSKQSTNLATGWGDQTGLWALSHHARHLIAAQLMANA